MSDEDEIITPTENMNYYAYTERKVNARWNEFVEKMNENPLRINSFQIIGIGYSVNILYTYFNDIIQLMYYFLYGTMWVSAGFGLTYVCYCTGSVMCGFIYDREDEDEDKLDPIDAFLEKDYDKLKTIYDNTNDDILYEDYENKDETFVKELKDREYHFKSELPFTYNKEITMYYDKESESFHYFTKNSDIQYKVLNSVCRSYVLEKKCVNLFTDTLELERMNPVDNGTKDDFEKVEPGEEEEEEKQPSFSLFVRKKVSSKNKPNPEKSKTVNKFIYKGNAQDYDVYYLVKETPKVKNVDYEMFKNEYETAL